MRQKSVGSKDAADKLVKNIRRKTARRYSAEEKIRIVLAGLRGEESIAALCRREGIAESLYYKWSKEFLEAGKRQLSGDTARQATAPEVKELRSEALSLKECVAELTLENRLLKKSMIGDGEFEEGDIPHQKSLRSSARLRGHICQQSKPLIFLASLARPSIAGTICIWRAGLMVCLINLHGLALFGTVSPIRAVMI